MVDPSLFTVERLLAVMFDDSSGNRDKWRAEAEIIADYMPPYPRADTRPICVVRFRDSFLRHSKGPRQGHFWDMYGDDYLSPELALMALLEAPVPPCALDKSVWENARLLAAAREGK